MTRYQPMTLVVVETLPTASVRFRGVLVLVRGGAGVADALYACVKKSDDTYDWLAVTLT